MSTGVPRDGDRWGKRCVGCLHEWEDLVWGDWAGEEVALAERGVHLFEAVGLLLVFDAFGDHVEVQALAEVDDRLHEVGFLVIAVELVDEGFVDLEDVDRELLQVR